MAVEDAADFLIESEVGPAETPAIRPCQTIHGLLSEPTARDIPEFWRMQDRCVRRLSESLLCFA